MASVVVDTDVVSFQFKGDSRASLFDPHLAGRIPVISFMTLAELDLWALEHRWGPARKGRMARFLVRYLVHPYDRAMCLKWAEVTNAARRKGRPIQPADAWFAATALLAGVPLVTNNAADYAGVDRLTVLSAATP
jgi:predicted nucleic acid-binding protein